MRMEVKEGNIYQKVTPSNIKIVEKLSDGNYMVLWFERKRTTGKEWHESTIHSVWNVVLYIGTLKGANKWKHKSHARITGNGSLEGLLLAKKYILSFSKGFVHYGSEMRIFWLDERRRKAYKRMLRYDGFIEDLDNKCICYRNPINYEWVG